MLALAAVAVAVVAAGLGGWGLRSGTSAPAGTPLSSATLLSASHQAAGKIFLYDGSSRWLYMSVDMPSGNGTVICEVESRDGHVTTLGSFQLTDGRGYWGSPVPAAHGAARRRAAGRAGRHRPGHRQLPQRLGPGGSRGAPGRVPRGAS